MATITEPQAVLQKSEHSRKGDDEGGIDDGMKGKLRRDTISGKLKFWAGSNANAKEKKVEGFPKMDEGTLKTFVEKVTPFDFEKDMGDWDDEKFSHDSSMDPCYTNTLQNWCPHRKNLAFFALCLAFSIVGMQRLMFVSVNAVITAQFSISSTQTASLTGIAFIFSAISSPFWEILNMKVGKRGIFIFAAALMLVGSLWNMHVQSYGQFLGGRIMQGVGWGAFEALVGGAMAEMYFESQLPLRLTILSIIDVFFTWGTPIIGGYLSQTIDGYGNQIMVMNVIQAISIFLLLIAFPETSFYRTSHPTPPTSPPTISIKSWWKTLHLMPYWGNPSKEDLLRPLKKLASPITLLTFVLASLPIASAYAFALSLSSFLSASPLFIFPSQVGYIFIGPFVLSLISYALLSIVSPGKPILPSSEKALGGTSTSALRIAIPGLILFTTGTVAFSQYVSTTLIPQATKVSSTVFVVSTPGMECSLKVISLIFGILVAGAAILGFAVERYLAIQQGVDDHGKEEGQRGRGGLDRAHAVLQNLFTGFLIIAMPSWIEQGMGEEMGGVMGLKDTGLGVGIFGFRG
ncbi:uncharacterized protein EAF02_009706 [Botrytis sinoallii]|uniref:uncharacterized protein n=1 Tax=Botrytis sinoallii TaxID=1463999 RepID=UPI00190181B3|nr:uncharacterized protein EAF02_009706 [Botrytis sinoallii]KAF7867515.1 hypothetical protein EAF02_009706 [Botrytis sinoallii]